MTGLDLFKKELLFESSKIDKKLLKIFYKFDINLIKLSEENNDNTTDTSQPIDNNAQTGNPAEQPAAPIDAGAAPMPPADTGVPPVAPTPDAAAPTAAEPVPVPLPSVVTEDDDKNETIVNDEDSIVRKMEGELVLQKEEVDEIQTVEDLITKLSEAKRDGINILDEFTSDIINTCLTPALQPQLAQKIDKKSLIFVEILYGKKKEDSVGVRIIKRKNSDLMTTSMMIDNKIINSQYKKETLDKRITDMRNDEFDTETEN
jgi:hypothetical protein